MTESNNNVGLFGYKVYPDVWGGDFLAEGQTKESLLPVENKARENGYTTFQYVYVDGRLPDFTGAINI